MKHKTVDPHDPIRNIAKHKQVEEQILRQSAVLKAINNVFQKALTCETEEELVRECLAVTEALTGSKFGWIGEVNKAGRLDIIAISNPGWAACKMPASGAPLSIKNMAVRGIWGRTLKDEQSQIVNDPLSHPNRVGVPEGHPSLTSFLGVPLKHGGRTIGMISLANKKSGYDSADQEAVETLSAAIVETLMRKRAEQELQESEEFFSGTLNDMLTFVAILEPDGKVVFVNNTPMDVAGITLNDVKGKMFYDAFWWQYSEEARQQIKEDIKFCATGKTLVHDIELQTAGGNLTWIEYSMHPVYDEDGEIKYLVPEGRDITERKQAEAVLKKSEARLSDAQRIAHLGHWDWNIVANKLYWSDEIYRIFGLKPQEFGATYEAFLDTLHPEDKDLVEQSVNAALNEDKPYHIDHRIVLPSGEVRIVHEQAEVTFESPGNPIRMMGTIQDITERKRVEEEKRLLQTMMLFMGEAKDLDSALRMALEKVCQVTGWIVGEAWVPRGDWTVIEYNRAWCREDKSLKRWRTVSKDMTFGPGKGLPGRAWSSKKPVWIKDVTHDPEFLRAKVAKEIGLKTGVAIPVLADDEVAAVLVFFLFELREEDERFVDLVSAVAAQLGSVVQRKRAEEALREARNELEAKVEERTRELKGANIRLQEIDRLKSEFLATMSHELRTPLNSIIGFTGIILKGITGKINEEQKKQLSMVYSSAKHLLSLINDILDLSRIESGKMEVSMKRMKVEEVISEVAQLLSPSISQKGLKLLIEIPEEIQEIYCDRQKVFQILLNLVNNAVKFTDQGEIKVKCKIDNDDLIVSVSDTGIGITKENMDYLFETFRQIDGTAQRKYQGAGLGLYLCKRLVILLGGEIWVESKYGKGSKFTFTLPLRLEEGKQHEDKDIDRRG